MTTHLPYSVEAAERDARAQRQAEARRVEQIARECAERAGRLEATGGVIDLMDALKQSLASDRGEARSQSQLASVSATPPRSAPAPVCTCEENTDTPSRRHEIGCALHQCSLCGVMHNRRTVA